jgi:predicted RNA-binding protein with PUA-like domain
MKHWLVKQEPEAYSWEQLLEEGRTAWTGVRNFQARNNLRAMKKGDLVLFYHSVSEKRLAGLARVIREAYPDPTAKDRDWVAVDLEPVKTLKKPVTLEQMKKEKKLANLPLLNQPRLSVLPLTVEEFKHLLGIAGTSSR